MNNDPLSLRAYMVARRFIGLVGPVILRRRLAKGKEDPRRWREKIGETSVQRPDGPLIWINAVGLGEVMSLRGLIRELTDTAPELTVLVTSTTRQSAEVFAKNLPSRTIHQYLPLDAPAYSKRFLRHWRPDAVIWAEQDLWPGMVCDVGSTETPQAIIAARMNDRSFASHQKAAGMYGALYRRMSFLTAQDEGTADHLRRLGAKNIEVTGSLKSAAPALTVDADEHDDLDNHLAGRFVWAVASSYEEDERLALAAHQEIRKERPGALLIVAPRQMGRPLEVFSDVPRRSKGETPSKDDAVWLFDTIGELGLVYRLSEAALIGGTLNDIEGHNPWEAARLECGVLHGPRKANFQADFAILDQGQAAVEVANQNDVAQALLSDELTSMGKRGARMTDEVTASLAPIAMRILGMISA